MAETSNLLRMLDTIQSQVTAIHKYLLESGQPEPGFDALVPNIDYTGVEEVRAATLDNLLHLRDLLSTLREILQYHCETDFVSRHALDFLRIYDIVPVDETRTYDQIAVQTEPRIPTKTVRRIVRHAITQRIFCEPQPGIVAHTSVSRLIAEDVTIRDYYGLKCQDVWPAATRVVDALSRWPHLTGQEHTGCLGSWETTVGDAS